MILILEGYSNSNNYLVYRKKGHSKYYLQTTSDSVYSEVGDVSLKTSRP
jgi:hypothetical protein